MDKTGFYLTSVIAPTFDASSDAAVGLGQRIKTRSDPGGFYQFNDPDLPEKLIDAYRAHVLPFASFGDGRKWFSSYWSEHPDHRGWIGLKAYCLAGEGRFFDAKILLDEHIADLEESFPEPSPHPLLPGYKEMRACLDRGPQAVAEHLRANELKSMQSRHLEKYWQPSPFPFEAKA